VQGLKRVKCVAAVHYVYIDIILYPNNLRDLFDLGLFVIKVNFYAESAEF